MRSVVAAVTRRTARSNASFVRSDGTVTPLILRTYWRAAASISSGVASGSSPRSVVMFRHMATTLPVAGRTDRQATASTCFFSSLRALPMIMPAARRFTSPGNGTARSTARS